MKVFEIKEFGLDGLQSAERPQPEPVAGQVLLRMRAVSLNYRDLLVVTGKYNPRMSLPRIPISDGVGEVVAVGEGVSRVEPGDRVAATFLQNWKIGRAPSELQSH